MKKELPPTYVTTNIGKIAVYQYQQLSDKTALIFLHGVYFDHHLWDEQIYKINDRTIISIDMPYHGASKEITNLNWNLDNCAEMLIEILNALQIKTVIAIGHSWGSMTILRACAKSPERFQRILLCNMPFRKGTIKQKIIFNLQHQLLMFRKFYVRKVAQVVFGKTSLKNNPGLLNKLMQPMNILSDKEVKLIDKKVILDAEDTSELIDRVCFIATAIKGEEDYVPVSPYIKTKIVTGGHVSSLESPEAVLNEIINITETCNT